MKRAWADTCRFFSNHGKEEREHWVVAEFLKITGVSFVPGDLRSDKQDSPVDVSFRDATFQVKEIPDPNIQRGADMKEICQRVMKAKTLKDTIGPGFVYDIPPVVNGFELIKAEAKELAADARYKSTKGTLDLLFYVTRPRASLPTIAERRSDALASLGWRSVSCVVGAEAYVLYAAHSAPHFLRVLHGS